MIEDIHRASERKNVKSRQEYYLLSKYEVLQCGDLETIIKKRQTLDETPVYYVSIEDTFHIVKRAHVATGHGGRDRMTKDLQVKYSNIHRDTIELFKSLRLECQKKRKRPMTKVVVVKPILSTEFLSRGQVDLIDMQSMSCRTFKWIMVHQDHLTKFCVLRPLTSKSAAEVADIFLLLGAPVILQSDNGSEFTAQIITELRSLWPELSIVHGKPRHPQSQGSIERENGDIKDMLVAWMADNNSTDWATGNKFVQFSKNSAYHAGIKRSPYATMFGVNAESD
ncbi:KRAB-A domain-containing protein 2-like [Palaemon carinicauda]|uniref:KRAB-A domain-containing protein 2-like n=1 Tax=Palaemon carinicauda TaxID=392227 RepID=UPI0035B61385